MMLEKKNQTEEVDTMFNCQVDAFVEVLMLGNFCSNILLLNLTCLGILQTFFFLNV